MNLKLKIIIGSTRPTRKGHLVAAWFAEIAQHNKEFDIEILDLQKINLPLMNEEEQPYLKKYKHQYTKDWSAKIDEADAFIIVTPEYNHAAPATIKNAIDYLCHEWKEKPVGFVSYGGMSGGMRAVESLKVPLTTLGVMPIPEGVSIASFEKYIDDTGIFVGSAELEKVAKGTLNKLAYWAKALKGMREK